MAYVKHIIYKDVTKATLILETGVNFTTYPLDTNGAKIIYKAPSAQAPAEWQAQVYGDSANGEIAVQFDANIKFNEVGRWVFWAKLIFNDSKFNIGLPTTYIVKEQGEE